MVFKTSGHQLITLYLGRTTASGKLADATLPGGCAVAAGVDVFAVSPEALPFKASHRGEHGEVWGYFAAAHMADRIQPAPGGCWVLCGEEKPYEIKGETGGYRSRFAFYVTRVEGDGKVMWAQTRWQMKEYRLDKNHTLFRQRKLEYPEANMDFVIRKFFAKPAVPLPPPVQVVGVRLASTKTKPKPKKVVPPPLPPYARSEGGEALPLPQGGSSLPPRSARPPRPPKVVAKPVAPPPTPQVIVKPVAPPPTPQVIAKQVTPPPTPRVIVKPVAPPPTPQVIAKQVAPQPTPRVIAKQVAPPSTPPVIGKQIAPQPMPQVNATAVVPWWLRMRSRQDKATSSHAQPRVIATPVASQPMPPVIANQVANANMELVVRSVPAQPVILPPPPAQLSWAERTRWLYRRGTGRHVIGEYLGPKAIGGKLPVGVTPGYVAEGVDVFAVSPDALPFPPSHRKQNGDVWGYFFAAKPTASMRLVHGGCWMEYGSEKKYCIASGQVMACRRRFAFHAAPGKVATEQTRWLMKEYRLNDKPAPGDLKPLTCPASNLDLVILKVFSKPLGPPPPPPPPAPVCSGDAENPGSYNPSLNLGVGLSRPVVAPPLLLPPPPRPPACTFDLPDMNSP